ncbi:MAG: hypothetical protein A2W91_09045 [Bacteroidetes bacterium GWF2_38_335]|nr:MAG: hypothetical protein A2W91_09045 [Bacteroidetes bacterium GWF2_38_335]OFY80517.1 MAG: hypothetical protein A2281_08770 [Bacteroidetes bacterium RIFOXYA12_FULL_38_20]HBS85872.1 hypothetical protein [Bacteroidales bacterium]
MNPSDILSNPAAIASIVVVALLLFVFVPFMIIRAGRQRRTARNYLPDLIRLSGLQVSQDNQYFQGQFKGFPTVLRMGVGYNYASAAYQTIKGLSGGRSNFHSRSMIFQKFTVEMDLPKPVNDFMIKERAGILRTDQRINDAIAGKTNDLTEIQPTAGKLKRVRLYGQDLNLANKLVQDTQLNQLIANWHYTDVRISGNKLRFTMDDSMVASTFGSRIAKPQFIVDGLDIAARVAQIASS